MSGRPGDYRGVSVTFCGEEERLLETLAQRIHCTPHHAARLLIRALLADGDEAIEAAAARTEAQYYAANGG